MPLMNFLLGTKQSK